MTEAEVLEFPAPGDGFRADTRDLMEGIRGLDDAQAAYEEAAAYFRGTIAEKFANKRIQRAVQESGKPYRFRLAAKPVRVIASRCRIAAITGATEAITRRIEEIRQANDLELLEPYITRETLALGDGYVMVWQGAWPLDEDDGGPDEGDERPVQITYHSPLGVRALYDTESSQRPRCVVRRWQEESPLSDGLDYWRAEVWYADRMEAWICEPGSDGTDPTRWRPYAVSEMDGRWRQVPADDFNWPEDHDWGEIPFKHARTDLPYGRPVHRDAYGPQDLITKATATQGMELESHGWAERWRILNDDRLLEAAQDSVDWDEAADAPKAEPGQVVSGRRRGAGVEHDYSGTDSVGEYRVANPGELIAPVDQWIRLTSTVTDVPLWEYDPRAGGDMSGVARERADAPLRETVRDVQRYLKAFWRQVWTLALRMDGTPDPGQVDVMWAPPEVVQDREWWETARVRNEMGVPQEHILQEANYLPDNARKWVKDQAETLTLERQVGLLERIGAAVQALGAGVAIGLLTQEQAAMAVERVIGPGQGETEPDA